GPEAPLCFAGLRRLFQGFPADADSGRHKGDLPEQLCAAIPGPGFRGPNREARPVRGHAPRISGTAARRARIQPGAEEDARFSGDAFGEVKVNPDPARVARAPIEMRLT